MNFEQRADRRLRLKRPAPAMTRLGRAAISDLCASGISMVHDFPLKVGDRVLIEFNWNGIPMRLNCSIATTRRIDSGSFLSGMIVRAGESAILYKRWVVNAINEMMVAETDLPSRFSGEH